MMIARWHCEARFSYRNEVIALIREWEEEYRSQTGLDHSARIVVGSVGAEETAIESEFEIGSLAELEQFFDNIATIKMHDEWAKRMSEILVGSTRWEVYRIVE